MFTHIVNVRDASRRRRIVKIILELKTESFRPFFFHLSAVASLSLSLVRVSFPRCSFFLARYRTAKGGKTLYIYIYIYNIFIIKLTS